MQLAQKISSEEPASYTGRTGQQTQQYWIILKSVACCLSHWKHVCECARVWWRIHECVHVRYLFAAVCTDWVHDGEVYVRGKNHVKKEKLILSVTFSPLPSRVTCPPHTAIPMEVRKRGGKRALT